MKKKSYFGPRLQFISPYLFFDFFEPIYIFFNHPWRGSKRSIPLRKLATTQHSPQFLHSFHSSGNYFPTAVYVLMTLTALSTETVFFCIPRISHDFQVFLQLEEKLQIWRFWIKIWRNSQKSGDIFQVYKKNSFLWKEHKRAVKVKKKVMYLKLLAIACNIPDFKNCSCRDVAVEHIIFYY